MSYMEINKQSESICSARQQTDASGGAVTAAVVCEYNPFHNGHRRHLALTRSLFGAEYIMAVMSGNFVQRGDCAVFPKRLRAKAALLGGADIVFELPLPWCMAAAERFAFGGVSLADAAGCADILSFGSECGDISAITAAADILGRGEVYERSRELQKSGMTFAAARSEAAAAFSGKNTADILKSPNDILGVEYVRAINRLGSGIRPVCVLREGSPHDSSVSGGGGSALPSASSLRELIVSNGSLSGCSPLPEAVRAGVPPEAAALYGSGTVTRLDRLDRTLTAALRLMSREQFAALPDVSEGLEYRIYREAGRAQSFEALCAAVKCKRYTMSRIRRVLLYALLGIPKGYLERRPPYLRLLGMNGKGERLLRRMEPALPIVATFADEQRLVGFAREVFELNTRACEIYAMCAEPPLPRGCDFDGGIVFIRS